MKKLLISTFLIGSLLFALSAHAFPIFYQGYITKKGSGEPLANNTVKAGDGTVIVNLRYGGLKKGASGKAKVNVSYKVVDSSGNAVQKTTKVLEDTEFTPDDKGKVIVYFKMPVGSDWKKGKYNIEFAVKDLHGGDLSESRSKVAFTIE